MFAFIITSLLVVAMPFGQLGQPQAAPPVSPARPAPVASATPAPSATPSLAEVPENQPVITIHGLCASVASSAAKSAKGTVPKPAGPCTTIVTRAQLDKLISALNPQNQAVTPQIRRQFAQQYAELLTYGQAAKKAGTEDADFAELMRFVRLSTLVRLYRTRLDERYRKVPDSEIAAYYKQNSPKFEEISLGRIFIPAKNPSAQNKDDWEKKAAQVANDIHDRAAKGEDLEKLQKEAYTQLGLTTTPASTNLGARRRAMLPQQQDLFSLKAGEISKVEQEPAGYVIYKVESKQIAPLEKVKDEISRELFRQKMEEKTKEITAGVRTDLNEKYFGPALAPPSAPASVLPPGARPAATPGPSAAGPQSQTQASPAAPKP